MNIRPPAKAASVAPRAPRASREPLEAVLELGRKTSRGILAGLVLAMVFHGTAAARAAGLPMELMQWSQRIAREVHERLADTIDVDITKPVAAPEPPPPPEPQAPKEEPKEAPPPPPPTSKVVEEEPPPPPAAAQAGAVLTQAPDPNEPVDLTGQGFVTGTGSSYAGGITQAGGTSQSAVYNRNARAGGVPGGTGTAQAPVAQGPDRARSAGLSGSSEWKCPWPSEADAEQIDDAYVTVQVTTKPDGSADHVSVLTDPGHGFAREARLCAMRERYIAALDHGGNPIPGVTKAFKIHFER